MVGAGETASSCLPPVLIRADASPEIGTGHVMRCLGLAQAWQAAGVTVRAACASLTPALEARLRAEGIEVSFLDAEAGTNQDAGRTLALASEVGAGWLVVDGYQFSGPYQQAIARCGLPLLFVDDYGHAGTYWASLVLNQNAYAADSLYGNREPAARLLLGTAYALLRAEFSPWRGWARAIRESGDRLLVTLGGADPSNATLKVIEALRHAALSGLKAKVVVGGSNPHVAAIRRAVQASGLAIEVVENAGHMPELMAWADVALSAAGSTCWELAFMQLPALLLVLAENQRPNAEHLARLGAAVSLGHHSDATPSRVASALVRLLSDAPARASMAREGAALVDGHGAGRVAELLARGAVRLRPATAADCERLFSWANDPLTRQMSFRSRQIGWDEHRHWFERVLADPGVLLLVAEAWQDGAWAPAGQVRFDAGGAVSLAIAPGFRGRRLAVPLLRTAVVMARAREPGRQLVAFIKLENEVSQHVFSEVGFRLDGPDEQQGQPCVRFLYGNSPHGTAPSGESRPYGSLAWRRQQPCSG